MSQPSNCFQSPLSAALNHALKHLTPAEANSVGAQATLTTLRQRLDLPLNQQGIDALQVLDELVAGVEGGIIDTAGGRFFGWVIGGSLPAALAADWLTSAWDQNAGLYACSPAAAVVEETAGRWLKELLGIPATASFAFVTGCQMAHVTCLAAARHAVLARAGWNVEQDGLAGSPAIRILTSTEKHGTTTRAVRFLGLGEKSIVNLAADDKGCLLASALEAALQQAPSQPTIVVLQAGDVNIGAFDDFATAHSARAPLQRLGAHRRCLRPLVRCESALPPPPHRRRAGRLLDHRRPQVAQRAVRLRLRLRGRPRRPSGGHGSSAPPTSRTPPKPATRSTGTRSFRAAPEALPPTPPFASLVRQALRTSSTVAATTPTRSSPASARYQA